MDPDPDAVVSASQACRHLGISRPTLYSWVSGGRLKPWKRLEGGAHLFLRSDLGGEGLRRYFRPGRAGAAPSAPGKKVSVTAASVLIISRDAAATRQLTAELEAQDCRVHAVGNWRGARRVAAQTAPEAVILDLDIPRGRRRLAQLRALRAPRSGLPAPIFLTISRLHRGPADAARALRAGASDFLRKPFSSAVFRARLRRLLSQRLWKGLAREPAEPALASSDGRVLVDRRRQLLRLKPDGAAPRELRLTRKENDLLCLFLQRPGRLFPRRTILEVVWGYVAPIQSRTLDCHISGLRRKLGAEADRLQTARGLGYRLLDR